MRFGGCKRFVSLPNIAQRMGVPAGAKPRIAPNGRKERGEMLRGYKRKTPGGATAKG